MASSSSSSPWPPAASSDPLPSPSPPPSPPVAMASDGSGECYSSVYDSVRALAGHLGIQDPDSLFDKEAELPEWLVHAEEHELVFFDPASFGSGPDPRFPVDEAGYWVKVCSADALHKSCAMANHYVKDLLSKVPVYIYVLPTVALHDADSIGLLQPEELGVMSIRIVNANDLYSKRHAYTSADTLLKNMKTTKESVEIIKNTLQFATEEKVRHAGITKNDYEEAKKACEGQATTDANLNMLAASTRLHVQQEVVNTLEKALKNMNILDESLEEWYEVVDTAMKRSSFMGCPVPPPPPAVDDHAGADAAVASAGFPVPPMSPATTVCIDASAAGGAPPPHAATSSATTTVGADAPAAGAPPPPHTASSDAAAANDDPAGA